MNKILMNNRIIENEDIIISDNDNTITANGKCIITIINQSIDNLVINANQKSQVIVNDFRIVQKESTNIKLFASESANITYNHAYINKKNYELKLQANYDTTKACVNINIRGINDGGMSNIIIDGTIDKDNYHNHLLENIKIINLNGGKCTAIPNMMIANARVIANHNVTIGKIAREEVQYLQSKGLNPDAAKKLILNGFLINIISDQDLIIKIKEILN